MPNKNNHINYSLADIEKYLQGKLNANEMHAIEKEALQNPFLADAIEGYRNASMQESHQHLNEIEQLILNKKQKAEIVPFLHSTKLFWGVAASVLTVAIIGSIIWMINSNDKSNKSISETNIPAITKKDSAVVSLQKDSPSKINHLIIASDSSKKKKLSATALIKTDSVITLDDNHSFAKKDSITSKQDIIALSNKEYHLTNIEKNIQHETAASNFPISLTGKVAGVSVSNKSKNIEGRITDTKGKPIPNSTILLRNNRGISSDANGYFSLNAKDSVVNSTITALGYTAANTTLYNGRFNNISLKESSQSLNDVVVVGYGSQRKKAVTGSVVSLSNKNDTLSPQGGWDKFKVYILNKISDTATFHGNLEFEIELNNNGDIEDVSISQSPDNNLNPQIIEAIKNGPKWINTSSRKIVRKKLSINF